MQKARYFRVFTVLLTSPSGDSEIRALCIVYRLAPGTQGLPETPRRPSSQKCPARFYKTCKYKHRVRDSSSGAELRRDGVCHVHTTLGVT